MEAHYDIKQMEQQEDKNTEVRHTIHVTIMEHKVVKLGRNGPSDKKKKDLREFSKIKWH